MGRHPLRNVARLLAFGGLLACSISCHAVTYLLSQGGFSAGGRITGSFSGEDVNGDGFIAAVFTGEVTSFSLSFSGNAIVPAFTYGWPEFRYLVYEVGTGYIGDSSRPPYGEGLMAGPIKLSEGYQYNSGILPIVARGAVLISPDRQIVETSTELLAVSPIPEASTGMLFAAGLVPLLLAARRQGTRRRPLSV